MVSVPITSVDESNGGLIELALGGDEGAFAQIVRLHHAHMVRVCFVVCGDLDLAEEAVQAAWPIAWLKLSTVRTTERLRPWLVSVAVNEARQLVRRRRRRTIVEISVVPGDGATWPDPAGRDTDLDLAHALAGLAPDDRALLALRYVAGLNSTELGRALGMSASGTRARLARLLDRLRKDLDDA